MRLGVSLVSLLVVLAGTPFSPGADRQMPYKAYVVSDGAYVRSGPGKNYYPTMKLPLGAEVEVYRHDPGGWYAIRPPKESFTWVAARYVEVDEEGLGAITGEQVAARVGSAFSDIRDVIQVRLHEGEAVEILGEKQFTGTSEAGRWYRIAPPAGEFRWIFGRMVDPDYMTSGVRQAPGNASPLLIPATRAAQPETQAGDEEEPGRLSELVEPAEEAGQKQFAVIEPEVLDLSEERIGRAEPASEEPRERADWVAAGAAASEAPGSNPTRAERAAAYETPAEAARESADPAPASPKGTLGYISPRIPELNEPEEQAPAPAAADRPLLPFDEALGRLELELSQMLAEEPTVWSFTELEIQAQSLLERASTALERGKVRLALKKIDQSKDVKTRYVKFVDTQTQLDRREERIAELRSDPAAPAGEAAETGADPIAARYDGYGRLGRVVTSDPDAPRFALVDDAGKVTCFVTPAPGVNLDHYVGERVGVVGAMGYIPKRQARHVTAKHVSALGTALR